MKYTPGSMIEAETSANEATPSPMAASSSFSSVATALTEHAAIALIHADRLRAAHDDTKRATQALRDGLLRFARLGQAGMLGVTVGTASPSQAATRRCCSRSSRRSRSPGRR